MNVLYFQDIGHIVRQRRTVKRLSQRDLAAQTGVARTTLNQLENGTFPDLGVRKVMAMLKVLGLELKVGPLPRRRSPDYLGMAAASASVSYRDPLTADDLARVLLTAKVPAHQRPHLRAVLVEVPVSVLAGAVRQVASWSRPQKIHANLESIASEVGSPLPIVPWTSRV